MDRRIGRRARRALRRPAGRPPDLRWEYLPPMVEQRRGAARPASIRAKAAANWRQCSHFDICSDRSFGSRDAPRPYREFDTIKPWQSRNGACSADRARATLRRGIGPRCPSRGPRSKLHPIRLTHPCRRKQRRPRRNRTVQIRRRTATGCAHVRPADRRLPRPRGDRTAPAMRAPAAANPPALAAPSRQLRAREPKASTAKLPSRSLRRPSARPLLNRRARPSRRAPAVPKSAPTSPHEPSLPSSSPEFRSAAQRPQHRAAGRRQAGPAAGDPRQSRCRRARPPAGLPAPPRRRDPNAQPARRPRCADQEFRPPGGGRRPRGRRLSQAARGRRQEGRLFRRDQRCREDPRPGHANTGLPIPSAPSRCRPRLGKAYLDLWASAARRLAGEPTRAGRHARSARQALQRSGMVVEPVSSTSSSRPISSPPTGRTTSSTTPTGSTPRPARRRSSTCASSSTRRRRRISCFTNPELLRTTLDENAENLVARHAHARRGHRGRRRRAQDPPVRRARSSRSAAISRVTPGKVIYQNELMQLIQYAPTTATVLQRPLLIVPPWINKFYVLDLTPEKSFIKWCVDQGLTVFVHLVGQSGRAPRRTRTSPTTCTRARSRRSTSIKKVTGETEVNAIGYCVGGTLLAMTLAYMAAQERPPHRARRRSSPRRSTSPMRATSRCSSTTRSRSQSLERHMAERGYLEGKKMATAFNLLRSNDLIWPYVVNNYLKGEAPFPFDLLYWNSDATRMPAANHSYYLRNCYLENNLTKGKMDDRRRPRSISARSRSRSTISPPARTTSRRRNRSISARPSSAGRCEYVLSGSGHIAGVVNPPEQGEVPVLDRRHAARRRRRRLARPRRPSIRARGGPTGSPGSRRRIRPRCRRARPAAACSSRSRTRRGAT